MAGQPGFFDQDERLRALSAAGDPLERLAAVIDFEVFRSDLIAALSRSDRAKGGRPPYDPVLMFKVLVLQTLYTLSDDQTEYQLKDRLSFTRFVGLALHDLVPDAKTIWLYREQLARAGAAEQLFARFDALLRAKGWLAMGGQIVDATVIEARRPRLTQAEKDTIKGGGTPAEWTPARRAQIDRDGRWTIKRGKKREAAPGAGHQRQIEIAVPDGMKVDVQGNVYCTGPGGTWVYAADGTHVGTIKTPEVPANLAFGGPDMKTLFFTAHTSVYSMRVKVAGLPGHPFKKG